MPLRKSEFPLELLEDAVSSSCANSREISADSAVELASAAALLACSNRLRKASSEVMPETVSPDNCLSFPASSRETSVEFPFEPTDADNAAILACSSALAAAASASL